MMVPIRPRQANRRGTRRQRNGDCECAQDVLEIDDIADVLAVADAG